MLFKPPHIFRLLFFQVQSVNGLIAATSPTSSLPTYRSYNALNSHLLQQSRDFLIYERDGYQPSTKCGSERNHVRQRRYVDQWYLQAYPRGHLGNRQKHPWHYNHSWHCGSRILMRHRHSCWHGSGNLQCGQLDEEETHWISSATRQRESVCPAGSRRSYGPGWHLQGSREVSEKLFVLIDYKWLGSTCYVSAASDYQIHIRWSLIQERTIHHDSACLTHPVCGLDIRPIQSWSNPEKEIYWLRSMSKQDIFA